MDNKRTKADAVGIAVVIALLTALLVFSIPSAQSRPAASTAATGDGAVFTCTTDSLGGCSLPHGLGVKPTSVVATVSSANGATIATSNPANNSVTTFRVTFYRGDTGARFGSGVSVTFNAHFDYVPGATTPPPTTTPPATTPPATTPPATTPPATTPPPTTPTPSPTVTAGACANPVYTTSARENNGQGGFSNGGFVVHNNMWNDEAGPQTLSACTYKNWFVTSNQPGAGNDDSVKTYPGSQKLVSIPVSSTMPNLASSFNVAVPPGAGTIPTATSKGKQWNAAYDLWANNFGVEIMVWNTWTMNWRFWYGRYGGEQVTIDGVSYSAYHDPAATGNSRAMWFVRNTPVNSGTVNLGSIAKWALGKGWLTTSDRLNAIEYGFEIAYTGTPTRFDLLDYSLTTS